MDKQVSRRNFISLTKSTVLAGALGAGALCLAACGAPREATGQAVDSATATPSQATRPLPPSTPNTEDEFGVDSTINMTTIEDYLYRDDVWYRDLRMLFDTARYDELGGDQELSFTLPGFRVIPYPYIGTLPQLPVEGRYAGDVLYVVEWNEDGSIRTAIPKYAQSAQIIEEVFPQDKAIFLMCGGGGYAAFMKKLLIFLGWDEALLYNVGGAWDYEGQETVDLVLYDDNDEPYYFHWRAQYTIIDFSQYQLFATLGNGVAQANPVGVHRNAKTCRW